MTLERLTQITSVGISSGITLSSATLTGVTTLTTLSAGGDIDAVNGTFSGNVSIAGTLTYEDVTNIDSVGLITARSGIHVTGGSVGIGTDNPQYKLEVQGATTPAITVRNTTTSSYSRLSAGEIGDGEIFAFQRLGSTSSASGGPKAGQIWNYADAPIVMGIGSTVRQKIQGDGKIVVGGNANQTANRNLSVVAESGNSNNTEIGLQPTNSSGGYNPEVIIGTTADGTYGAHMFFTTRDTGGTRTERIRITSNGLVGIGLTNPGALLSIPAGESNTPRFAIESAVDNNDFTITQYEDGNGTYTMLGQNVKLNSSGNNTILDSGHRTAGILLDARNHGAITFLTGDTNAATENVKIDANSTMYVGTGANPGSARVAIANNFINGNGLGIQNTGPQGGGQYFAIFYNSSNAISGSISHNGSATVAFNTSSDYRLKENVVSLTGAADRVNQIQVHRFNFIADPDKTVDGFLAHEVQSVVPECVTGEKDAVDDEGNPVYQGIDQSKLVPLLTAALQEAFAKIETLETRLTALEGQ